MDRWTLPPVTIEQRLSAAEVGETIPDHLTRTGVPDIWGRTQGDGVKVGIVDTGVARDHEDLIGQVADVFDSTGSTNGPWDIHGHGTHVAGIVAAMLQNGVGVAGVAPRAKLFVAKGLGDSGSGTSTQVARAVDWCVDAGCDVINMSLGSNQLSQTIARSIRAAHAKGVVMVAANGNDSGPVDYPGALPETISVSALGWSAGGWRLADFSSRGEPTDLAAPGVRILSTYRSPAYARLSGTSMAAPFVSGLVALLLALDPSLARAGRDPVLDRLGRAAMDLGDAGEDPLFGRGLVVPRKLLEQLPPPGGGGRYEIGPLLVNIPAVAGDLVSVGWRG